MQSVMNVVMNRSFRRKLSPYAVVVEPEQFSSMTSPGDPQLGKWPEDDDQLWITAIGMAEQACAGVLQDITGAATNYYAESIPEPWWAPDMDYVCTIAGQKFFKPRTT